ncbi:hypothetical protein NC652_041277 [Populus alba x Populus x berolinensis]|nr:hypothetical protein NC652_041274 [Populus alba x Populus x berolinensis]KAJ6858926.1 hypothetical protein NC652_041277 [Populus alba x Populus x berolinensis]
MLPMLARCKTPMFKLIIRWTLVMLLRATPLYEERQNF